ncbi:alpha-ketoglutarate-dependent dioxygenase AlkB [Accumulibacter sp.]|uniref:alpha-ketoglutarate-dependent dioxygenase AlkB n=1 Tax=Accumulibacter sp. TaxID=2053492 RepID=UPI0026134A93|nr:alpha-ketoglutarate-dependent dioxygenase AlkB [Accumulibacter sp.]
MKALLPEGFRYVPEFLVRSEHDVLLDRLRALRFDHDVFRGRQLKRGWAQFGYQYLSTGRRLVEAPPMPPFLVRLVETGRSVCPDPVESFNQCIVTHYQRGAGIGWHTDAPRFGEVILGISLGAPGRMQFRVGRSGGACCEMVLQAGSLYVMSGPARWAYQHRVVPVASDRWSLTFRHVGATLALGSKAP